MRHVVLGIFLTTFVASASFAADQSRHGNWKVIKTSDRFNGRITYLLGEAKPSGSLSVAYEHDCEKCSPWQYYSVSLSLNHKMTCPYSEEDAMGSHKRVYVKWMIDDGPIHTQEFDIIKQTSVSYRWIVHSVSNAGNISKYRTIGEIYADSGANLERAGVPLEVRETRVIPANDFVMMLAKGKRLYFRVSDRCSTQDMDVDLVGLTAALGSSGIQLSNATVARKTMQPIGGQAVPKTTGSIQRP